MAKARLLRYQVATSLDGFIAGPKGEFDWIPMDPDIDFAALFGRFDAILMGRKTFAAAAAMHGSAGAMFGMPTYVVSTTLKQSEHPGVTVISSDVDARVRALKTKPGKEIWLYGGGQLLASLLKAGLVDAIELAIIPILLGQGVPFLAPTESRHALRLQTHRIYPKTGTALLTYEVLPATKGDQKRRRKR